MADVSLTQILADDPTSGPSTFDWTPTSYRTEPAYEDAEGDPGAPGAAEAAEEEELASAATVASPAAARGRVQGRPLFYPSTSSDESDPFEEGYGRRLERGVGVGQRTSLFSAADFFGVE